MAQERPGGTPSQQLQISTPTGPEVQKGRATAHPSGFDMRNSLVPLLVTGAGSAGGGRGCCLFANGDHNVCHSSLTYWDLVAILKEYLFNFPFVRLTI